MEDRSSGKALREQLARVGEEKERARRERSGPVSPELGEKRIATSLRLWEEGMALRRAYGGDHGRSCGG